MCVLHQSQVCANLSSSLYGVLLWQAAIECPYPDLTPEIFDTLARNKSSRIKQQKHLQIENHSLSNLVSYNSRNRVQQQGVCTAYVLGFSIPRGPQWKL